MLPSFAQAFADDSMSTTLPPIRKRHAHPDDDDPAAPKKRRLTPSPHPLRTDLDPPPASTPVSPIGLTVDHVRSVKQIRKKQEALIEQRRGSVGALTPDDPHPTPLAIPAAPSPAGPSSSRLPPPPISFANRAINARKKKPADLLLVGRPPNGYHPHTARLLGPHPPSIQSAPPSQNAFSIPMALPRLPSNLISGPPPAIAGSRRVPPTPTRLSMLANSAPSAPSLPSGKSSPASVPIATTLLPHTPTSLTINRAVQLGNALLHPPSIVLSSPSTHPTSSAPPTSSTSSTSSATPLAQTPAHAQAAAKQAFLAPFELFYDALQDARQLKDWLKEQLTRTAALTRKREEDLARLERERDELRRRGSDTSNPNGLPRVKTEEGEGDVGQTSLGSGPDLREELEWLRRRVDELEARFGTAAVASSNLTATVTASSSSSTSSNSSSNEGYTFPQQQQQYEMMQQQREYQRQRERQDQPPQNQRDPHPQPAMSSLAPQPLPAISRRLSLSGRPELGRRLSSPGWHPSSASSSPIGTVRGGPGTGGHRVGGWGGDGLDDRHGHEGSGRMAISKSLSGPGTCGGFSSGGGPSSGGSGLRRRGRRVSISGEVVPGAKSESLRERSERLSESEKGRAKREKGDKLRVQGAEEGMKLDSVGGIEDGAETHLEGGGENEPEREPEREDRDRR